MTREGNLPGLTVLKSVGISFSFCSDKEEGDGDIPISIASRHEPGNSSAAIS